MFGSCRVSYVSIKDVARIAGVSIATVSRCLNSPDKVTQKTRIKVQDAILRTGYRPNALAQSFRRGRTNMVMVVLPRIGTPFFADVIRGIRTAAEATGYSILIDETQSSPITADEIGAMVVSRQADGIILLAGFTPNGTDVLSERRHQSPPVVIGCESMSPELAHLPAVHIDNVAAAGEATNYLISNGHKRIAMIYGLQDSPLTRDREYGFRAAMNKAQLSIEDGWVVEGKLTIDGAREATRKLLNHHHRPTAIFCASDEMAIACMHEVKAAKLSVPADISVVGFDDIQYAEISDPPLTTISQPANEIGERLMHRLCREIEEGPDGASAEYSPELLPHRLIVRDSVATLPG